MKTIALMAVLAAIFVAGCVSTNTTPQPQPLPTGKTVDVAITNAGFEPSTVTIDAGDAVAWTNQADRAAWPASDDHPTHTKLSGFDTLRGLAKGESYQYTFTKQGAWGYHDHLRPAVVGTVTVK